MKPPNRSIDELMASVHQGDPTAFELLVQGIRDGMVAVSLSMVDFLLMKEHSYLSALGLKALGFSMFHDPGRTADAAAKGHVSPSDLLSSGHADMVVPSAPKTCSFADNVKAAITATIDKLLSSENPPTRRWKSVET
jgi:acetyl-CoA carboxylase alpha subunit